MAKLDAPLRRVAEQVVSSFGASAVYVQRKAGNYNSTKGKRPKAEFKTDVKGVFQEYSRFEVNDQIRAGDRKFIIAASAIDFQPQPGDQVKVNYRRYRVESADATMSGDEAALWTLQLRGTSA